MFVAYGQGDPTLIIRIQPSCCLQSPVFLSLFLPLHSWHWKERVHVDVNFVVEIQRFDHYVEYVRNHRLIVSPLNSSNISSNNV